MLSIKGKKCGDLVIDTSKSMRNDEDFNSFFEVIKKVDNPAKLLGKPTSPRKQEKPNYSILQYVTGYEVPRAMLIIQKQATTISNQCIFKLLMVISTINDRFGQPALKKFRNVEELFLKAINQADLSKELKVLESDFRGDFDRNQLESELHLVPEIFKQSTLVDFSRDLQHVSRHG